MRAATFEVVLKKPERDPLSYEKPLPLELLPYAERTDKYWSVGTAFAIAPNTFVSAGHVLLAGVGSQFGIPALRDAQGNVYPVDRVIKFSLHEDFAVFTLAKAPAFTVLQTNTKPAIDEPVFAVGNALGDGVVIRDGLLTSMTPEDQDGRWKWLRFSAAASPGNSGGPLLDVQGNVVGIVTAGSQSENLNYALPIDRVLDDSGKVATMDVRENFTLPILAGGEVSVMKDSFPLPQPYSEFSKRMLDARFNHYQTERNRILAARAAELFPRGESAKLLASLQPPRAPSLVVQDEDRVWIAEDGSRFEHAEFGDDGHVKLRYHERVALFEMKRPGAPIDDGFYADSRAFVELLLKGLKFSRPVGQQAVRVTSMGVAEKDTALVDRFSRRWQLRSWPAAFMDVEMMTLALPTPQGYVGIVRFSMTSDHRKDAAELALLADQFQAPYTGTLAQWQAFMKRSGAQTPFLSQVKLEMAPASGVKFKSGRLEASVPAAWFKAYDTAELTLDTVLIPDGTGVTCDIGRFLLELDGKGNSYVYAKRQAKPLAGAGKESQTRWDDMLNRRAEFAGAVAHDDDYAAFWVRSSLGSGAAGSALPKRDANVLYEIAYHTDLKVLPRELESRRNELMNAFKVVER